MTKLWTWLYGKKTYIIALAGIVYAGGIKIGWWTNDPTIDLLLGSTAAASMRHGITTSQSQDRQSPIQ